MATTKELTLIVQDNIANSSNQDEFYGDTTHREVYLLDKRGRSQSNEKVINVNENDTIELLFEDGLIWYATPDDFNEILDTVEQSRSDDGKIVLSSSTHLPIGKDRGKSIIRKLIRFGVLTASELAAKEIASKMEKIILGNIGLNILDDQAEMKSFDANQRSLKGPVLLLLHGTGSSTHGSFADIFLDKHLYAKLYKEYGGNILAFEHETWSINPLDNTLKLINSLPESVDLHIISYSRGGLIGDLICMLSEKPSLVLSNNSKAQLIQGYQNIYEGVEEKKKIEEDIDKLFADFKTTVTNKKVTVSRYVRIACPAAGTTLLSDRLDLFFNTTMNLIGQGAKTIGSSINPIVGVGAEKTVKALRTVTAEILRQRADITTLPGLEAMRPESPFIQWINHVVTSIDNTKLYVVTGNSQMKFGNWRALKTILSKLYYLRKNDFVVDTISMYAGSRFGSSAQYFVQNNVIDHFRYFQDKTVRDLLSNVLGKKEESHASLKSFVKGDQSSYYRDRGVDISIYQEGIKKDYISGQKPVIILLPGIMGTHLDRNNEHIWLNFKNIVKGKITNLKASNKVNSDRINASAYLKFYNHFEKSHDIITAGYDWRNSLETAAKKLAVTVNKALKEASSQQISIVAHSMGGLVVKQFMMDHDKLYDRIAKRNKFRFVMLGTPWKGSYLVPYTLLGYGNNINVVSLLDVKNNKQDLLNIFKHYEGFLQMLPQINDQGEKQNFVHDENWLKYSEIKTNNVGIPTQAKLDKIEAYFKRVNIDEKEKIKLDKVFYIAGQDNKTVNGIVDDYETWFGKSKLKFRKTKAGDGSVTWAMGIPKELDDDRVYFAKVSHGELANDPKIFAALEDILSKEKTTKISGKRPSLRSGDIETVEYGEESFITDSFNFESDILGLTEADEEVVSPELEVSIVAGDLRHASYPVILGHFWKDGILSAEKAMDNYLNKALSKKHHTGSYPQWIGDQYVYLDPEKSDNFWHGAVVVGLGKVENFNAIQLQDTVRAGAIEYVREVQRLEKFKNNNDKVEGLGITSLLICSGYGNLQVSESLKAIIKGIGQANEYLLSQQEYEKVITKVELIELYNNKAQEAMYELCSLDDMDEELSLNIMSYKEVKGAQEEMPYKSRRGWWQPFTISSQINERTGQIEIDYTTEIRAARSQKRNVVATGKFLDDISSAFAISSKWDEKLAKVMFEMLIPNEFKAYVRNQNNLKLNLDKNTANYPWEMIHDMDTSREPLCINAGLIRQLQTTSEEQGVRLSLGNKALVIGDPRLDGYISQLPGAKQEAELVTELLRKDDTFEVKDLIRKEYKDIILEIFSNENRILHLAGHGVVDTEKDQIGMVIGHGHFLKASDIKQMSRVPELVFINCCHLGKIDGSDSKFYADRNKLAASLSTQFIESGAKAVIAAGWAIDDDAANEFAQVFYQQMMAGEHFHYAIRLARKKIYDNHNQSNTWGAFQCYGDPYYKFDLRGQKTKTDETKIYYIAKEVNIALQRIRARSTGGDRSNKSKTFELQEELEAIVEAGYASNLMNAANRELLAYCYANLNLLPDAISEVEELMKEEKSLFTVRLLEQYYNWKVKQAIIDYNQPIDKKEIKLKEVKIAKSEAKEKIEFAINLLNNLIEGGPTGERHVIRASAYRRLSLVSDNALNKLEKASIDYHKAYQLKPNYYHLSNWILVELLLCRRKVRETIHNVILKKDYPNLLVKLDQLIAHNNDKDFWSYSAKVHSKIVTMLHKVIVVKSEVDMDKEMSEITDIYKEAWNRSGSYKDRDGEIEHYSIIHNVISNQKFRIDRKPDLQALFDQIIVDLRDVILI